MKQKSSKSSKLDPVSEPPKPSKAADAAKPPSEKLDPRTGIARLLPRKYVDLNTEYKPIVGAAMIIAGVIPCVIFAWLQARTAADKQSTIDAMLAAGTGSPQEILALTEEMKSALTRLRIAMLVGFIYPLSMAFFFSYISSKLTKGWLEVLIKFTDEVATGDLTRVVVRDNGSQIGDIQEALGKMLASFRATINRIEVAANDLRDAAGEMAHTSDEAGHAIGEVAQAISSISEGASHQVDLVTQTSGVVGEIERSVRAAAEHASKAQEQSADTEALTEEGVLRATEVQEAMQGVRETSIETSEMIRSLGEKSTNIDQIVQSITDIAAQTNLLALNAAIEAARAGEQGRGFAVVAEEVRKLAEDAQESAGDIASLVQQIREQTEQAVVAMDSGVSIVEQGFDTVNRNRQTFFDISGAVRALHESSSEISTLAGGIARDAGEVRGQIEDVASVAEESSASTEQVSASTEETSAAAQQVTASAQRVAATAENLASLAGRFKTTKAGVRTMPGRAQAINPARQADVETPTPPSKERAA